MDDNERSDLREPDSRKPPHIIGDFKVIKELGKGAQGTVYGAEQISLKREVALKVLPAHLTFSEKSVLRFKREAEAGGRQSHPGIVAIYAVGDYEGTHYIAQELVGDGVTLTDNLNEFRKKGEQPAGYFRETAKLIVEVADALKHAHDSGVIHRDVKPSNILLTKDGRPKVSDFGLAKVEDALALSRTGDFAGTPYYMSPEQAMSRRIGIDHRTDIFSLGVTLYEMLTLQRPFEGKTSQEVFKQIVILDPINPHKRNPRVPQDLSVICLKAMEKDPNHRYQSMAEFAKDLNRFLDGDVILARPAGIGLRVWKRVKRNPVVSAAVGVALAAIVVFAVVVPWVLARKEKENAALLTIERDKAVVSRREALRQREIAEGRAQVIQKNYNEIMRLSDIKRLSDLEADADALWPAYPENIPGFEEWLTRSDEVLGRLDGHRQALESLRRNALHYGESEFQKDRETHPQWEVLRELKNSKLKLEEQIATLEADAATGEESAESSGDGGEASADPRKRKEQLAGLDAQIEELEEAVSERRTWKFKGTEKQWQYDMLAELVSGLEAFSDRREGLVESVRERFAFAATIEEKSVIDHQAAWNEAIVSIADREECPRYNGLVIERKVGFVPIGSDPVSGLWEFAHLQTGDVAERGRDGKIICSEEMGLVFVLIPGGVFHMGAVKPSGDHPIGSPNVDPEADLDEGPVHEVTLKPFFLSKYEMTQGQWLRFAKDNPSIYGPGDEFGGKEVNLLHPVEQVSWEDCVEVVSRLKLRLPSESEWEYAARAGTSTVFWTGDEERSLKGAANLADLFFKNNGGSSNWPYEKWLDDGYTAHAPVGSFSANAFGLHEVYGNVWEWCEDIYTRYENTPTDGSANERGSSFRVYRGGGWNGVAFDCRSADRDRYGTDGGSYNLGLRPACSVQE